MVVRKVGSVKGRLCMIEIFEQNERLKKLMHILMSNNDWVTGSELAQQMGVSDRTIRHDITVLKKIVSKYHAGIESIRGKGYFLEAVDRDFLNDLIYSGNKKKNIVPEDRIRYIIGQLILFDKTIDLGELEDELFVSQTTVENDLRVIEQKCLKYNPQLKLRRQKNRISIEGNEISKRYALNELFSLDDNWLMQENNEKRNLFNHSVNYKEISSCVLSTFQECCMFLEDKEIANFISFLAIAEMRIRTGYTINYFQDHDLQYNNKLSSVTNLLVEKIEGKLNTKFNDKECSNIVFYLSHKRIFHVDEMTSSEIVETIDRKYVVIVESLLKDIKNEYLIDLTNDDELFKGLVLHVKALVNKISYSTAQKNPILTQLKNKYPYIFELSMFFSKRFKELFDKELNDDDLSYISAHLGAAIERFENQYIQTNFTIAVISHLSYSASRWLLTKLKSNFGTFININGPYSIFDKNAVVSSKPNLILTTLPVNFSKNEDVSIIAISPLLNQKDVQTISAFLTTIRREFIQPKLPEDVKQYFEKDLFFTELNADTPTEAITIMSERLNEKGYIPSTFLKSVIEREEISSTSFLDGFAIPHPIKACSYKTVIAVGILKKPIMWGENKVKCVFFLAIRDEDKKYLGRIFNLIVEMTENKTKVQNVIKSNSFEQFINLII